MAKLDHRKPDPSRYQKSSHVRRQKRTSKRTAAAPPPLSAHERNREEARRRLSRTLKRDKNIRSLARQLVAETERRDNALIAMTRHFMGYFGIVEAEAPGPPLSEDGK